MSAPQNNTGFVSLMDYLNANKSATDQTAQGLNQDAVNAADKATQEFSTLRGGDASQTPQYATALNDAQTAQDKAKGLGTFGGLSNELQSKYGGQGYSAGDRALDANLLAGNAGLQTTAAKYGGLVDYLNGQMNTPPTKAAGGSAPQSDPYGGYTNGIKNTPKGPVKVRPNGAGGF